MFALLSNIAVKSDAVRRYGSASTRASGSDSASELGDDIGPGSASARTSALGVVVRFVLPPEGTTITQPFGWMLVLKQDCKQVFSSAQFKPLVSQPHVTVLAARGSLRKGVAVGSGFVVVEEGGEVKEVLELEAG